jgi:hypothetical protein
MMFKNWDRSLITVLLLILGLYSARINWHDGQWQHVIESDGKGYYAYLPAVFVFQDLHFAFYDSVDVQHAYDPSLAFDYRSKVHNVSINKFYAGTAFCIMPFFILAHGISILLGLTADGYAHMYVVFLTLAALFYLGLGLDFFRKLLLAYQVKTRDRALVIVSILMGTNLFYYAIGEVSMSHVYSFAWVSVFLLLSHRFLHSEDGRFSWWLPFSLGMIIFIRPVNGLIIFTWFFLAGDIQRLLLVIQQALQQRVRTAIAVVLLLIPPFLQLLIYKLQTGHFLIYSYGQDYFDFTNPHFSDFLWSYRKGYFIYTPMALIACVGFWAIRKNRFQCISLLGFYTVLIYILSSWWNWYYGGSFSSRVLVEFLPLTGLLFAFTLQWLSSKTPRWILYFLIVACIALNQFQTLQYRYYMIHWSDMDQKQYWDAFLRWDSDLVKTKPLHP